MQFLDSLTTPGLCVMLLHDLDKVVAIVSSKLATLESPTSYHLCALLYLVVKLDNMLLLYIRRVGV